MLRLAQTCAYPVPITHSQQKPQLSKVQHFLKYTHCKDKKKTAEKSNNQMGKKQQMNLVVVSDELKKPHGPMIKKNMQIYNI